MKEAGNSPWEHNPEQAFCAMGLWIVEQGPYLLLYTGAFRKQDFVNKQECSRDILFYL